MSTTPFTRGSENKKRISDIAVEIESLSIELQRRLTVQAEADEYYSADETTETKVKVKTEDSQYRAHSRIPITKSRRQRNLSKPIVRPDLNRGDTVRITNSHRGNFGRVGTIIRRSRTTADVQLTNPDGIFNKWVTSLEKIEQDQNSQDSS